MSLSSEILIQRAMQHKLQQIKAESMKQAQLQIKGVINDADDKDFFKNSFNQIFIQQLAISAIKKNIQKNDEFTARNTATTIIDNIKSIKEKDSQPAALISAIEKAIQTNYTQIIPILIEQALQNKIINGKDLKQTATIKNYLLDALELNKEDLNISRALSLITFAPKHGLDTAPNAHNIVTQASRDAYNKVHEFVEGSFTGQTYVGSLPCVADIKKLLAQTARENPNKTIALNIHCYQEPGEQIHPDTGKIIRKWGHLGSDGELFTKTNPRYDAIYKELQSKYPKLTIKFTRAVEPANIVDHSAINARTGERLTVDEFKRAIEQNKFSKQADTVEINLEHCQGGMARSAMFAICGLIDGRNYSLSEACNQVKYGKAHGQRQTDEPKLGRKAAKNFEKFSLDQKELMADYYASLVLQDPKNHKIIPDQESVRLMLIYCSDEYRTPIQIAIAADKISKPSKEFVADFAKDTMKWQAIHKAGKTIEDRAKEFTKTYGPTPEQVTGAAKSKSPSLLVRVLSIFYTPTCIITPVSTANNGRPSEIIKEPIMVI